MSRDKIIAIDPSLSSTGICVLGIEDTTPTAYYNIRPYIGDPRRLQYIFHSYQSIFNIFRETVRYIAYEKQVPQMRYNYSSHNILDLAENIGILKLAILETVSLQEGNVSIIRAKPEDIKRYATNNPKATKEDMIDAVNGHHIKTIRSSTVEDGVDDVVDAYHLSRLVQSKLKSDGLKSMIYEGWW